MSFAGLGPRQGGCDDDQSSTCVGRVSQAGARCPARGGPARRRHAGVTGRAADEAVKVLYQAHYAALVRTATVLVGDVATAEDVVQDSFIAMQRVWWRLRDTSRALPYLRSSVLNRSRSVLRHRAVADRYPPMPAPELPSAEEGALAAVQRSAVLAALNALTARQREVLVLRYYADLSEAEIAAAMGITRGAVKSHTSRAKDSLRAILGTDLEPSRPREPEAPPGRHIATGPGRREGSLPSRASSLAGRPSRCRSRSSSTLSPTRSASRGKAPLAARDGARLPPWAPGASRRILQTLYGVRLARDDCAAGQPHPKAQTSK